MELIIFITFNMLMYILAFSVAYAKNQNVTVYLLLLGIQVACLLLFFLMMPKPSPGDMGIGSGIYFLFFLCVQIFLLGILVIVFLVRLNSMLVWITLGALPIVAAVVGLIIYFVDFNNIYLTLLPVTNEKELAIREGIIYTSEGKPYTGRAKYKGDDPILYKWWNVEGSYRTLEGNGDAHYLDSEVQYRKYEYEEIWRLTHYKNGIKEGKEKFYLYLGGNVPKIFDIFDKKIQIKRTRYFGYTSYKNGLKDGEEKILYPHDYFGRAIRNAQYSAGELLWVKKTDISGYDGSVSVYDEDSLFDDFKIKELKESDMQRFNYRFSYKFENEKAVFKKIELYYCNGEYNLFSSDEHAFINLMRAKPYKIIIDWTEEEDEYSLYIWLNENNALKVFDAIFEKVATHGELFITISSTQEGFSIGLTLSNGQMSEEFEEYEILIFKNGQSFLCNEFYNRPAGGWNVY